LLRVPQEGREAPSERERDVGECEAYDRYVRSWTGRFFFLSLTALILAAVVLTIDWLAGILSGDGITFPVFLCVFFTIGVFLLVCVAKSFSDTVDEEYKRQLEADALAGIEGPKGSYVIRPSCRCYVVPESRPDRPEDV